MVCACQVEPEKGQGSEQGKKVASRWALSYHNYQTAAQCQSKHRISKLWFVCRREPSGVPTRLFYRRVGRIKLCQMVVPQPRSPTFRSVQNTGKFQFQAIWTACDLPLGIEVTQTTKPRKLVSDDSSSKNVCTVRHPMRYACLEKIGSEIEAYRMRSSNALPSRLRCIGPAAICLVCLLPQPLVKRP